jgi:hypothetical protein
MLALEIRNNTWIFNSRTNTHATRIPGFLDEITQLVNQYNVQTIDG